MDAKEFEAHYWGKTVVPRGDRYKIPIVHYLVTAALYKYEEDETTIFSILHDKAGWYTIEIGPEELEEALADFDIVT